MPITVTMIEEKEFKTKVRGYDPVEVDEFLDAICDEMIEMQGTIQSLRDQLKQQSAQPFAPLPIAPISPISPIAAPLTARGPALPSDIESAQKLLAETQLACDKVLAEAKKRAESLIRETEGRGPDPQTAALADEKERLQKEIEALKKEAQGFRKKLQAMLRDQSEMLETEMF